MPLLKAAAAAAFYGTSISNLRKWAREGSIKTSKTAGGHYLYVVPDTVESIEALPDWNDHIVYVRCPEGTEGAATTFPTYNVISDIGCTGTDYNRPGFTTIMEQLLAGNVKKVIVARADEFCAFGFEFFQWLFAQYGAELIATTVTPSTDALAENIMNCVVAAIPQQQQRQRQRQRRSAKK